MKKWFIALIMSGTLFCSLITYADSKPEIKTEEVEKERLTVPCEWCDELGMYELMKKMKITTQLLTQKLKFMEWDQVNNLFTELKSLYGQIDVTSPNIPEDYFEFHDDFLKFAGRFAAAIEKKDFDDAEYQFKRVKTACHHCHIRYVRRKQSDDGIALERLYKDQFNEWGDGKSYPLNPNFQKDK